MYPTTDIDQRKEALAELRQAHQFAVASGERAEAWQLASAILDAERELHRLEQEKTRDAA